MLVRELAVEDRMQHRTPLFAQSFELFRIWLRMQPDGIAEARPLRDGRASGLTSESAG